MLRLTPGYGAYNPNLPNVADRAGLSVAQFALRPPANLTQVFDAANSEPNSIAKGGIADIVDVATNVADQVSEQEDQSGELDPSALEPLPMEYNDRDYPDSMAVPPVVDPAAPPAASFYSRNKGLLIAGAVVAALGTVAVVVLTRRKKH